VPASRGGRTVKTLFFGGGVNGGGGANGGLGRGLGHGGLRRRLRFGDGLAAGIWRRLARLVL
jgi:hypothetical protein